MSDPIETKNAIIESATLTTGDHGLLSSWVHLKYVGGGQGFGGFALYLPKSFANHALMSVAGHWIFRVMQVAGVEDWSKLPGRTVRVKADWGKVHAIGHIIEDDWFYPEVEFKQEKK